MLGAIITQERTMRILALCLIALVAPCYGTEYMGTESVRTDHLTSQLISHSRNVAPGVGEPEPALTRPYGCSVKY